MARVGQPVRALSRGRSAVQALVHDAFHRLELEARKRPSMLQRTRIDFSHIESLGADDGD